jgi:hypothetical protein
MKRKKKILFDLALELSSYIKEPFIKNQQNIFIQIINYLKEFIIE